MDFNKIKEIYLGTFRKYAEFTGRANREEFWTFFFVNLVISIVLSYLDRLMGSGFVILDSIFSLIILIPGLAVGVRRLHDIGKPGTWILLVLIPIVGWIWLLILCINEGEKEVNAYGPIPQEIKINDNTGNSNPPQTPQQPKN